VALATTPAGNGTVPQAEINMLANILAACVNSNGAVTGGTNPTACYTLFTNAMSGGTTEIQPTDTATAAINMAHNPGTNVANLYGLSTANPPFAPALGSQPSDFTIALSFTGGGIYGPFSLAIDGLGNVWMVNTANSISEINGVTGAAISPAAGFTGNGLSSPFAIAIDPSNNAWVVNPFTYNYTSGTITAPTSVSEFTAAGGAATGSPFTGGGLNIAPNLNTLSPRDIAFDANGNAWIANNSASVTELNGLTGAAISPVTTGYSISSGIADPNGVAVDAKNHVWVCGFNGNTLYLVNGNTGALLGTSAYGAGGMEQPYSIAIDGSSNVWMPNQYDPNTLVGYTVSEFSTVTTGTAFSGGGILGPNGVAIDGLGNVWISNEIHVGSAPGAGLTEMNNSGAAVSPSTGYLSSALYAGGDVGVDGSGNVWIANAVVPVSYTNGLNVVEFVGAAAPVVTPLSVAVKNSKIGARP
jgi:streptogramin lyase